MGEGQFG